MVKVKEKEEKNTKSASSEAYFTWNGGKYGVILKNT